MDRAQKPGNSDHYTYHRQDPLESTCKQIYPVVSCKLFWHVPYVQPCPPLCSNFTVMTRARILMTCHFFLYAVNVAFKY
jgi:hypothetical protein